MSEPYEALDPNDIGLLMGIAGPLYAESKEIDRMTGTRPQDSTGAIVSGTEQLKRGLENIVQGAVKTQSPHSFQPPPQYIAPPQPTHIPLPATQYCPETSQAYPVNQFDPQLEFDFSLTEQKKTNELLEKNNKLLQKLISLLESKNKDETIKLETKIKGIQSIPQKSFKD
jgi:predicted component of type VI protein secretion system